MSVLHKIWLSVMWWRPQAVLGQSLGVSVADHLPFDISRDTIEGTAGYTAPVFPLLPFNKYEGNPIMRPNPGNNFESAYLYNPTTIVLNETIFMLYRAQNASKTSSIGLAWSHDGTSFTRLGVPVLWPTEPWEHSGGCEDPRVVRVDGTFYMTYTAFDNRTARLCLATSEDLINWTKYPPLFPEYYDVHYNDIMRPYARHNWTKSGAIVTEPTSDGLYHMYFGDSHIYHATSTDLINWNALPSHDFFAAPQRPWEDILIEPGPPPIKTRDGKWLLVYNGESSGKGGYGHKQYSVGQMLIDPSGSWRPDVRVDPGVYQPAIVDGPIARLERPILWPDAANEVEGQVDNVVFAEGLVQFKGKWYMYYGQGDSELGVAIAEVQP